MPMKYVHKHWASGYIPVWRNTTPGEGLIITTIPNILRRHTKHGQVTGTKQIIQMVWYLSNCVLRAPLLCTNLAACKTNTMTSTVCIINSEQWISCEECNIIITFVHVDDLVMKNLDIRQHGWLAVHQWAIGQSQHTAPKLHFWMHIAKALHKHRRLF
jgi:hypothetical protein